MGANKFGCFVASRRKELNMTQNDRSGKNITIQVVRVSAYLICVIL